MERCIVSPGLRLMMVARCSEPTGRQNPPKLLSVHAAGAIRTDSGLKHVHNGYVIGVLEKTDEVRTLALGLHNRRSSR